MSWAGGPRSKSGNRLERPASGMDFLKEEDGEKVVYGNNGSATEQDKSVNDVAAPHPVATAANGAATNGDVATMKNKVANGTAVNGAVVGDIRKR